jgi:hypothetical protein
MSYWILTEHGNVISCTTVQRLTNLEKKTDEWKNRMHSYDTKIESRLNVKDDDITSKILDVNQWNKLSLTDIDDDFIAEFNKVINDNSLPEIDDSQDIDTYLNMELGLPRGDDGALQHATVKRRKLNKDGERIGTQNSNPLLDTRVYEIEFLDGTIEAVTANIIAKNLLSQVDSEGQRQLMLDEIIDHRTNGNEVPLLHGYSTSSNGKRRRKLTTRGWELCVLWKDGSTNWIALKDLKDSYPIELSEYAINNKIDKQPAFAWWVPYVQQKKTVILSKIKSKYWQRSHKFGL